jgi:hypothetical protein
VLTAIAWIARMGFRLAFDAWAHTSAGRADLVRFSSDYAITTADARLATTSVGGLQGRLTVRAYLDVSEEIAHWGRF